MRRRSLGSEISSLRTTGTWDSVPEVRVRAGGGGGVTSAHPATPTLRRPVLGPRRMGSFGCKLWLAIHFDSSALQRPWLLMGGLGTSAAALGKMTGVSAATVWPWSRGRKTKPAGEGAGHALVSGGMVNLGGVADLGTTPPT